METLIIKPGWKALWAVVAVVLAFLAWAYVPHTPLAFAVLCVAVLLPLVTVLAKQNKYYDRSWEHAAVAKIMFRSFCCSYMIFAGTNIARMLGIVG